MTIRLLPSKIYTKLLGGVIIAGALLISNPISADAALGDRVLKQGMTHNDVKELQVSLKKTNYFTYPTYTTYYGSYTKTAVTNFQKKNKLKVTGVADQKTVALIKSAAAKVKTKPVVKTAKPNTKVASVKTFNASVAKNLAGIRYTSGGTSPKTGFDCSGYVTYVMKQHGVSLPRKSSDMYNAGRSISAKELQPGDLVFYDTNSNGRKDVSHVAIYVGSNTMIHSASKKVEYDSLSNSYWNKRFVGARRVL
ncbi:C40 family peptidase [Fictibacillus sp. 7GRE50]|uniref:C40 family peptidase n=1 Tax=Fictibacillus sp. 7GRE50 TaxID=2745878 RepID=UPI0018CCCD7F|nr:NlpC/P60 family protein [Fictibacillus sp. 7GRE50]MBH0164101.1 C40 family peptidase [Fictibacillus sp. 7GRE50]